MAEDREALIQHYREIRATLLASIDGIEDAMLTAPTLDGWSVKDHLAHIAFWDRLRAEEVTRISAGHESAWRMTEAQHDVFAPLLYAWHQDLSLGQVRWELASSHELLLEALAQATPTGLEGSRYGEAGLRSFHEAQHVEWIQRWRGEQSR